MPHRVAVAAALLASASFAPLQTPASLSAKEQNELVDRYLALDSRTDAGRAEQKKIVERLDTGKELSAEEAKSWRAKLSKLVAKRSRELETKSGAHYWWPAKKKGEADRGLYIVGGETKSPKGLIIGMHGGGAGEGDAWSAQGSMNADCKDMDWLAIFPEVLEKTEHGWTDSGSEEFVMDLVESALCTWKIDRNKVFLGGHSMGGYGTWTLGAHHADQMAALVASAGAPTPIVDRGGSVLDVDAGVIPCLRNVPIRIYQSDDDPNVPPAANRMAAKRLGEAKERWGGFDFEYWEVPNRQHQLAPGGFKALFEKIADKKRLARPDRVVWQPVLTWTRQFYWLWWDQPVKGAIVTAELDRSKNEVRVAVDKPGPGLCVLLDDGALDLNKEIVVKLGDKEAFRGKPKRTLSTLLMTAVRNDAELSYCARVVLIP
jgi:pimeloyl-ACP methyl ester carboxylesterase